MEREISGYRLMFQRADCWRGRILFQMGIFFTFLTNGWKVDAWRSLGVFPGDALGQIGEAALRL